MLLENYGQLSSSSLRTEASMTEFKSNPSQKKLLVLDLDETLVHCRMENFESATSVTSIEIQGCFVTIHIAKRPGLKKFLKKMSKYYQLAIYTSSIKEYAHAVLNTLRIKKFFSAILHREHCSRNEGGKMEKSLSIIKKAPSDIILVDDSLVHKKNQPDNLFIVKDFRGDMSDNELETITPFLKAMSKVSDVRSVEKKFAEFQRNAEDKGSISTKGLGDKTYETKLIQRLNGQYKHKAKGLIEVIDQTIFGNTDEGITDANDLLQKLSQTTTSKQLFFHMVKSNSPKNACTAKESDGLAGQTVLVSV